MPRNENRLNRINEELKKEISNVISFELKNPNVTGLISVTKAKITPDLKYAKIYVSILNSKNIKKTRISRIYKVSSCKNNKFTNYT